MQKIDLEYNDLIESRLDRYLRSIFPLLTNGLIQKYLRNKDILLNQKKVKSSDKIKNSDKLIVPLFFKRFYKEETAIENHYSNHVMILAEKLLDDYLVFSNEDFIVINKPNRLPTQGGIQIDLSIDHALSYLNRDGLGYRIVHRLDKDTSGLLIIACSKDSARLLTGAFKERKIEKKYKAILFGNLEYTEGWLVDGEYRKYFDYKNESQYHSATNFKVLSKSQDFFNVEFSPITGKKHQLRIDAEILGAPVLGDKKYGGKPMANLMLHAEQIRIPKEIFGENFLFKAPIPDYFI